MSSTTRWQHCPGSTQNELVLPSSSKRRGVGRLNLNPKPDFFPLLGAKSGSAGAGPLALLRDSLTYARGSQEPFQSLGPLGHKSCKTRKG